MADFGEKVPDDRQNPRDPDGRPGDEAPDDRSDGSGDGPSEAQKRQRLIASRLIVAGVGLTFLIVGFVQFLTK